MKVYTCKYILIEVAVFVMIFMGLSNEVVANDQCNCVVWVRNNYVKSLPYNLCTLDDKKIIRNSQARKGSVAIIDPPFYLNKDEKCGSRYLAKGTSIGHVAYVTKVTKKKGADKIKIIEANYKSCRVTEREGTEKELKIIGYYQPQ